MWKRDLREIQPLWWLCQLGLIGFGLICALGVLLFLGPIRGSIGLLGAVLLSRGPELLRLVRRWRYLSRALNDDDTGFSAPPDAGSRVPVAPRTPRRPGAVEQELPLGR